MASRIPAGMMRVRGWNGRPYPTLVRKRPRTLASEKKRRAFLKSLRRTCNVKRSAANAGLTLSWVYTLRRENEDFRRQWEDALEEAYMDLELYGLERARFGGTTIVETRGGVRTVTTNDLSRTDMIILTKHWNSVVAIRARQQGQVPPPLIPPCREPRVRGPRSEDVGRRGATYLRGDL